MAESVKNLFRSYSVELKFTTPFAASIPRDIEAIRQMLEARMPSATQLEERRAAGEEVIPIEELAEQVASEVPGGEDVQVEGEVVESYATFKRDEHGLYYEARCIRGHIKDCATQVASFFPHIGAFKAKVANRVYVSPEKIYLDKSEPDGCEVRFIHAMTRRGVRSIRKSIDYINDAVLRFELRVLEDGVITEAILRTIFEYGGVHGMGQERSQDWGRYQLTKLKAV